MIGIAFLAASVGGACLFRARRRSCRLEGDYEARARWLWPRLVVVWICIFLAIVLIVALVVPRSPVRRFLRGDVAYDVVAEAEGYGPQEGRVLIVRSRTSGWSFGSSRTEIWTGVAVWGLNITTKSMAARGAATAASVKRADADGYTIVTATDDGSEQQFQVPGLYRKAK